MKSIDIKQFAILIIFIVLGAITVICAHNVERYLSDGPELLADNAFKQVDKFWTIQKKETDLVKITNGMLTVAADSFKTAPGIWQRIDGLEVGSKVEIRGVIKCEKIIPGEKRWDQGRFLLYQYDSNNNVLKTPHVIAGFSEEADWDTYKRIVKIEKEAAYIKVRMELRKCKGLIKFKELSLQKLTKNPLYKFFQFPVLFLWGLFLFYVIKRLIKVRINFAVNSALIVTLFVIVAGTTLPGNIRMNLKDFVDSSIIDISSEHIKPVNDKKGDFGRKIHSYSGTIVHFIFFTLFGFLLFTNRAEGSLLMKLQFLVVFAGATEMMQFFVDERGPHLFDFLIDFSGGITGLWAGRFLFKDTFNSKASLDAET